MRFPKKHPLLFWFAVVLSIMAFGILGFMLVQGYSFFDALYMTVITITTIGYSETQPLSTAGRVFNIIFIFTSFATFTFAVAALTRYVADGQLKLYLTKRKLMKEIKLLQNHVIICGFGRNGQQAARTLKQHKVDFVVIDQRDEMIDNWTQAEGKNLLHVKGDATDDVSLQKAGIEKAHSIICALPNDANNVFIVLTAKTLNPSIKIISRASALSSVPKLKTAGATSVSLPDMLGGIFMATQVSKPDVIEFIEYLTGEEGDGIHIESVDYEKLPPEIRDKTLQEVMDWKKTGVTCVGLKDEQGKFIINPSNSTIITSGFKVIVLGNNQQINAMKHNVDE